MAAKADPSPQEPPITPDELVRRGMVVGGRQVRRYSQDFVTGEATFAYDPTGWVQHEDEDDTEPPLSNVEQGIVDVLRRNAGRRMQANEIAPLVGEDEDPYGGTFKRAVSRLKLLDLIEGGKKEGGYSLKSKQK